MPDLTGRDRLLLDQVTAALQKDDYFEQTFEGDDTDGIDKLRSIGRRAGRELGWRIRTLATALDTGRVRVHIVVEQSSPLRDELMSIRRRKLTRDAIAKIWPGDDLGPAD